MKQWSIHQRSNGISINGGMEYPSMEQWSTINGEMGYPSMEQWSIHQWRNGVSINGTMEYPSIVKWGIKSNVRPSRNTLSSPRHCCGSQKSDKKSSILIAERTIALHVTPGNSMFSKPKNSQPTMDASVDPLLADPRLGTRLFYLLVVEHSD
ncbi:hypothetical protein HNY73_021162 [Argiope bruennichi]|uniref:Uncharacterized protein n=1 Tax=Argiope bruennichi TaxID=94029 RepID=A0A8T0EAH0_ARGBR|nr:hypothetical protein HNY73_021162 [Argiope bruennichi]